MTLCLIKAVQPAFCTALWSLDNEYKPWLGLVHCQFNWFKMQIKNTLIWILIQHLFLIIGKLHHAMSWLWKKNILLELKLKWSDQLLVQTRSSFLCQVWKCVGMHHTDVTADVCSCRPIIMSVKLQLCYCDNFALEWRDPVGRHVEFKGILPVLKREVHPLSTHVDQGQEPVCLQWFISEIVVVKCNLIFLQSWARP